MQPVVVRPGQREPELRQADPLAVHEAIAYDWLAQGGKRSRPFITLAVYDALKGAPGTLSAEGLDLPDAVRRAALAIETFHKASLVHDDIEDDDTFRYGRATLHRQYGVGTAINVGDYLIGLGYRLVGRELSIEYAALESGLERFVHPNKGQFLGRDALVAWQQKGFSNRFVTMEVHGVTDADARGSEPILKDGEMIGRVTSGGYGWRLGKSLALGMVRPDLGELGTELEISILGKPHKVTVIEESPFDPQNERLRA